MAIDYRAALKPYATQIGYAGNDLGVGLSSAPTIWTALGAATKNSVKNSAERDALEMQRKDQLQGYLEKNQTSEYMKKAYPQWADLPPAQGFQLALQAEAAKRSGGSGPGPTTDMQNYEYGLKNPGFAEFQTQGGGGPTPPYDGTSMDAQNWNILLGGDPNSPEYAAAYSQITQPKMTLQQTEQGMVPVYTTPQIPNNIRPPAGMMPQAGAPSQTGGTQPGASGISMGGALPGTQKPPTEQRARAKMMDSVISPEITRLLGDQTTPGTFDSLGNGFDVMKDSTGTAGRFAPFGVGTPSEGFLSAKSAVRTIIASYLYVASGATANPGEVENQAAILTPQVNDPPNVVADKKARLKVMADAVRALANGENVDLNAVFAGGQGGGMSDPVAAADALLNSGKY